MISTQVHAWGPSATATARVSVTISDPCTWLQNAGKCVNGVLGDGTRLPGVENPPSKQDIDAFGIRLVRAKPTPSAVNGYVDQTNHYE